VWRSLIWNINQAVSLQSKNKAYVHISLYNHGRGTTVAQWLRCCATNRKVAGSIPAGVIEICHWHKILPIALWAWGRLSLQHKWVPGVFPGGKGGRCVKLKTYHHPVPLSRNLGILTSWNPLGLDRPVRGLLYLYLFTTNGQRCTFFFFFCLFQVKINSRSQNHPEQCVLRNEKGEVICRVHWHL